ncbi:NAD(+)/NADH kinase [Aquihabitans sp. McL0605]|uniref:NAD(+)/NADH kinase n=1 Tax=Aquihabitans sp. McL0605 TaxID=3415671 RepID=UPI003CEB46E0
MSAVGLFVHGGRDDAIALAATVAAWLDQRGHTVVLDASEAALIPSAVHERPAAHPSLDLVVAIGGDGTVLRAARRAAEADADVVGINLGELGYLAEVEHDGWETALAGYFAGTHLVERRMLVASALADGQALPHGLNEVVIEKQALGRTVRLGVSIDGAYFTSYVADGLILATPTGSTAYSLSARGPIVAPAHQALVLTPVSPHTLFDRSLILEPSSVVQVEVLGDRDAAISIDGQEQGVLPVGGTVTITAAPDPARFVTFGGRNFHQILKAKFGLNDR